MLARSTTTAIGCRLQTGLWRFVTLALTKPLCGVVKTASTIHTIGA